MPLDFTLQTYYGHNQRAREIALALVRRIWLCRMRMVCTGWRDAGELDIDSCTDRIARRAADFKHSRLASLLARIHASVRSLQTPLVHPIRHTFRPSRTVRPIIPHSLPSRKVQHSRILSRLPSQPPFTVGVLPCCPKTPDIHIEIRTSTHMRETLQQFLLRLYERE